ncbi:hypothetical protein Tco_0456389 [Tanacetum coccineum]
MNDPISPVFQRTDQSGSRDSGLSSSGIGFNHSGLGLIYGRCAEPVSSESDIFAELEGASLESVIFQADDCGAGGYDEPKALESCCFFLLRSESGGGGGGS